MFGEGFSNFLWNNPGIQARLGTKETRADKETGVFPELAPDQSTFPWITYMQISGVPVESMAGMNALATARYRVSCSDSSYGRAKILAEAVRFAFATVADYQGPMSDGTVLENVRQLLEADDFEALPHGKIYTTHLDFEVMYLVTNED